MIGAAVALALFGGLFESHPSERTQSFQVQRWTAEVRTDAFTGKVSCRLRADRVTVSRGDAAFSFGRGTNTSDAVYKIDGAEPKSERDAMIRVAMLGVRTVTSNPSNNSGGVVHIPAAELGGASTVAIRANRNGSPRSFDLRGLGAAMDAEAQRGCDQTLPF